MYGVKDKKDIERKKPRPLLVISVFSRLCSAASFCFCAFSNYCLMTLQQSSTRSFFYYHSEIYMTRVNRNTIVVIPAAATALPEIVWMTDHPETAKTIDQIIVAITKTAVSRTRRAKATSLKFQIHCLIFFIIFSPFLFGFLFFFEKEA